MFKRKQDLDKHVSSILSRKKDEKERNAQGFQIARLYADIKEYAVAKKYLSAFLHCRDKAPPQAYHLMGEISEALNEKETAVDFYKRALDLGGFGSAQRQLILKICDLHCDIGNDVQRMKYWLEKCEQIFPKSETVFRMKSKLTSMSKGSDAEMESLLTSELLQRPTDLGLRIQLVNIYLDSKRYEEAYDLGVGSDLTIAFVESLPWFEVLQSVCESYKGQEEGASSDPSFVRHYLHVLRNIAYLRLSCRDVRDCTEALARFDKQLQLATCLLDKDEEWSAYHKEMKGQLFFLAGLLIMKKAQNGSISWKDANQLSGACLLASRTMGTLNGQATWFVSAPQKYAKFHNWWHQLSYDRLSQIGHMISQLSEGEVHDWSKELRLKAMTSQGQERLLLALYLPTASPQGATASLVGHFLYSASELVGTTELEEPLSQRDLLDVDRVASQVHLGKLSHLVWLCLQKYNWNMPAQPNYHFGLLENLQFSVKNLESASSESLCQLDVLVFLLASVRCAASAINMKTSYNFVDDQAKRPTLLPPALSKPLCSPEQEEWWSAAYKFCTNNVKGDFSRLRRVLTRGIETVRLLSPHGMSVGLMVHIAKSLEAKIKSLKDGEYGCRSPISEITALETRTTFYWDRVKKALVQIQRNIHVPMPKNRLFREQGVEDLHLPPRLVDQYMADANFALALAAMRSGQLEVAIEGFEGHRSPWAKFYCAQMYSLLGEREVGCSEGERRSKKSEALYIKARECLYEVLDRLAGDKEHDLNMLVTRELEDLEDKIHPTDWEEEREESESFHTPYKSPSEISTHSNGIGVPVGQTSRHSFTFSTPQPRVPTFQLSPSSMANGRGEALNGFSEIHHSEATNPSLTPKTSDLNASVGHSTSTTPRPRPSPERLDCQIKSLSQAQSSLFKMVLDRNEELFLINGKMMEELRDNNSQLKAVLSRNETLMQELKTFLGDNMDMMKQIKNELSSLKPSMMAPQAHQPPMGPPGPALFMPPPHLNPQGPPPPRGPPTYPGFPGGPPPPMMAQTYSYLLNSPAAMPPQQMASPGSMRLSGMPGQKVPSGGKFKSQSMEEDEEEDDEDLSAAEEAALFAEYYDNEYSQYFTPDPQMPPRMPMPAPGYFASALRGQSLQYAQAAAAAGAIVPPPPPQPQQVKPPIGPGFFSTPPASSSTPVLGGGMPGLGGPVGVSPGSSQATPSPLSLQGSASGQSQAILNALVGGRSLGATLTSQHGSVPAAAFSGIAASSTPSFFTQTKPATTTTSSTPAPFTASNVTTGTAGTTTGSPFGAAVGSGKDSAAGSTGTVFGGFTFTSKPVVNTPAAERAIAEPHKSPPAGSKDAPKPFAGFSLTVPTTKPNTESKFGPFGSQSAQEKTPPPPAPPTTSHQKGGPRSPGGGEEDGVEEYEPNVDFKPVIALPELVEKRTGEENEIELFLERCRLFRFDHEAKAWKERGIGEMKILKSKDDTKFRIIMRREQILKLCANHSLTADMRLTPMANSDRAWCYLAHDFSDEEMKIEQLAVKFKTPDTAKKFQKVFEESVSTLKALGDKAQSDQAGKTHTATQPSQSKVEESPKPTIKPSTAPTSTPTPAASASTDTKAAAKSLSELFKPKAGSWECSTCMVRNNADKNTCVACNTAKPGSKPDTSTSGVASSSSSGKSLSELFKPKAGSWECEGCLVRNDGDKLQCPACQTLKPGVKPEDVPKEPAQNPLLAMGGGGGGGFKFGADSATFSAPPAGGFKFGSQGTFTFGGAKPAAATTEAAKTTAATTAVPKFTFGTPTTSSQGGGFVFKPTTTTTTTAPAKTTGASTPSVSATTPLFSTPSSQQQPAATSGSKPATFTFGTSASPNTSSTSPFAASKPPPTTTTPPSTTTGGFSFTAKTGGLFTLPQSGAGGTPTGPARGDDSSAAGDKGLLAKLLTAQDDAAVQEVTGRSGPAKPTASSGFNFSLAPKSTGTVNAPGAPTTSTAPSSSGFSFSFAKSPAPKAGGAPVVPGSPEVDEHGLYVTKEGDDSHIHFEPVVALPDKIEVKTGEEEENILFESRGKMYRFVGGEWKEKGVGVVKILEHQATKKTRVLMRRDQVLKICCNHKIDASLVLQPMAKSDGKAWVWYAMDFSEEEGKVEQLALRFRNAEIAGEFKTVFDGCKATAKTTPTKDVADSTDAGTPADAAKKELFAADSTTKEDDEEDNDDVIFVREEHATPEQVAQARKFKLPDNFYLYETSPPCPGCLGCTDGEGLPPRPPSKSYSATVASSSTPSSTPPTAAGGRAFSKIPVAKASKDTTPGGQSTTISTTGSSSGSKPFPAKAPVFGSTTTSNLPNFASLTSGDGDQDQKNGDTSTMPFSFGGAGVDFSSLASNSQTNVFAYKQGDSSSSPFRFAGAGQKLFGASPGGGGGDEAGEGEGGVAPSEDIHFEPIIPLPDLVEVKTGEEDWTALFCQRAKLYKFDKALAQWKERGIGELKVMKHNTQVMFRILQRREQVLKVSCNHLITVEMELKPLATSETSWCWLALDLTDSAGADSTEPCLEQFAVKFKNKDIALEFQSVFESCQQKLKQAPTSGPSAETSLQQRLKEEETNQENEGEDIEEDDEEEEEEEDDDEEEDEEKVLFEKRVTLSSFENGAWAKLGMGILQVTFNEDLNGNSVNFYNDNGDCLCRHVICREHTVQLNGKQRSCEWKPVDFSTDEPLRKHFTASFSSQAAAEEFAKIFTEGQHLAADSELSENLTQEIEVPEIFSGGEPASK